MFSRLRFRSCASVLIVTRVILDLPKLRSVIPADSDSSHAEERLLLLGAQSKGSYNSQTASFTPLSIVDAKR